MVIVVFSYVQGVKAYASSGGSYVFARENLGTLPALVAGASLMVDYVLTVAVSVAAGVLALTSAVPGLESHRVALSPRLHRDLDARQPARRARVGLPVRVPDLRLHARHVRDAGGRGREVRRRHVPARHRPASARRRRGRADALRRCSRPSRPARWP